MLNETCLGQRSFFSLDFPSFTNHVPLGKLVKYDTPHFANENNVSNYCGHTGHPYTSSKLSECQTSTRMSCSQYTQNKY